MRENETTIQTSHPAPGLESAEDAQQGNQETPFAKALRRRPKARRTIYGRGRRLVPRLLEKSHHRENGEAAASVGERIESARKNRGHVWRQEDQPYREPRGVARGSARAARRFDRGG